MKCSWSSRNAMVLAVLLTSLCIGEIAYSAAGPAHNNPDPVLQTSIFPALTGNVLLDSLRAAYAPDVVYSYDTARDYMFSNVENNSSIVECIYTGKTVIIDPNEADPTGYAFTNFNFNTEHIYPQSKGASESPARSDLHHLRAAYGNVNSSRGNLPFGALDPVDVNRWWYYDSESNTYSQDTTPDGDLGLWSRTGSTSFQPRDKNKGDVARAAFYFYMMYETAAYEADPAFFTGMMDELLSFHDADPIDATEVTRNNRINAIQGNLNPFITDTTLIRRAFFQDFDPNEGSETDTEITINFDNESKSSYGVGNVTLDGISWELDNTLIGTSADDMKNGLKSARGRVPASLTMLANKTAGIGTITFQYARSNFSGDRTGTSPTLQVEVSTDGGTIWTQVGDDIDLAGVDQLTTFSVDVEEASDARIRIITSAGTSGKRFNIDDISITDWPVLSLATLSTPTTSDIRYEQLTVQSEISADGNSTITERGFVYAEQSLNDDPLIDGTSVTKITAGSGTGSFSTTLTGLTAGTSYIIKPYAINTTGTAYGEEVAVTTAATTLLTQPLTSGTAPAGWTATDITFATDAGGFARLTTTSSTLTSPAIDASSFTGVEVQLDVAKFGTGDDGPVTVQYSTDNGDSWNTAGTSGTPDGSTYLTDQAVLIPATSATLRIRFTRTASPSEKRLRNIDIRGAHLAIIGADPSRQNSGFRLLTTPVTKSLETFLEPIWTQGATGADYTGGDPNVFQFDGTSYQPVPNLTTTNLNPGESIALYLFELDEYGDETSNTWPKTLYTTGELTFGTVTPTLVNQGASEYNLVGNPFEVPIRLGGLTRGSVRNQVWVYDHAYDAGFNGDAGEGENSTGGGWRAWNGAIGSLSGGVIAPYQGFFVRNEASVEGSATLAIPAEAKTTGGQLYGADEHAAGPALAAGPAIAAGPALAANPALAEASEQRHNLHFAARIQGQYANDVWLGLIRDASEAGADDPSDTGSVSGGNVSALFPIDYAPFLMLYAVEDGHAYDIFEQRWLDGQPAEIELDLQAWKPIDDSGDTDVPVKQFVPMAGGVELIWQGTEGMAATLEDRYTGEIIDLQPFGRYEFLHNPLGAGTSGTSGTSGAPEQPGSSGAPEQPGSSSTPGADENNEETAHTLPYLLELRSPSINPNKTLPRFVLRVNELPTDLEIAPELPSAVRLEQNYPNPFNPVTAIRFALPQPGNIALELFDVTGRRLATIAEGRFDAGEHEVRWDGSGFASGVYLYRLRVAERFEEGLSIRSVTRRLTLVK